MRGVSITLVLLALVAVTPATFRTLSAQAGSPPAWSNQTRLALTITNTSSTTTLPTGYTVTLTITGLDASASTDLHVVYWNGSTNTELDRDIETDANTGKVYVRFETQASIAISAADSTDYWLYYGSTNNPGSPKNNLANVYVHYTDFTSGTWDSAFWGSETACGSSSSSGLQLTSSASSCLQYATGSYGTGYAVESTVELTSYSGTTNGDISDAVGMNSTSSGSLADHLQTRFDYASGLVIYGDQKVGGSSNPVTLVSSASAGTFYMFTAVRLNTSESLFSVDFGALTADTTDVPAESSLYPFLEAWSGASATSTALFTSFRLRLAIDAEPTVTITTATPTNLLWTASSHATSATGALYTWAWTTSVSGTLSSITMTVPSGTAGTPTVAANVGLGAGTVALAGTTLTYTITSPVNVSAGTAINLQISGLTNTATAGTYTSTLTTNTSGGALEQGTTPSLTFGSNSAYTAVNVWGQAGSFTTSTANNGGVSATSLYKPEDMVIDSSGNVYISDSVNNRILYYPKGSTTATKVYGQLNGTTCTDGTQAACFSLNTANIGGVSATSLDVPAFATLDSAGNLYVADQVNNRVLEYPSAGAGQPVSATASAVWGQPNLTSNTVNNGGLSASSMDSPNAVTVDSAGNLYVTDSSNNRVLFFPSGSTTATKVWGQTNGTTCTDGTQSACFTLSVSTCTATGMKYPTQIAFDSSGNMYISDFDANRVIMYPSSGSTTATAVWGEANLTTCSGGTSATLLGKVSGVVLDHAGNMYVADASNNRVLYYPAPLTSGEAATRVYGQSNFTSSTYSATVSTLHIAYGTTVCVDNSGSLYIADVNNNRILQFQLGLATTTEPASSYTSGTAFTVAYTAEDIGSGLVFSDYTGSVTTVITAGTGTSGAILSGQPLTINASAGVASYSYLAINRNGTAYTLTGSSSGYWSGMTSAFTITSQGSGYVATQVYGQAGSFKTSGTGCTSAGENQPRDVAVDSAGDLYVADYTNNRVLFYPNGSLTPTTVYGQGGSFTTCTANTGGVSATSLDEPRAVYVDSSNNLYIADTINNRVLFYANAGAGNPASTTATKVWGQGSGGNVFTTNTPNVSSTALSTPEGLAVDSSGNLYVSDEGNNRVVTFPSGSYTATIFIGQTNSTNSQANQGNASPSATTLSGQQGITLDASGNLYVADDGNARVLYYPAPLSTDEAATRVYGQGGSFTTSGTGCSATTLNNPNYVAVDAQGNVYVTDKLDNRLLYFSGSSTTATRVYGQANMTSCSANQGGAAGATTISNPQGLRLDNNGDLWVADSANDRIVEYELGEVATTEPPATVSSQPFSATWTAEDLGSGLTFSDYTGTVTASLSTNPTSASLTGTTSMSAVAGVAAFTNLNVSKNGSGYVLSGASSGYLTGDTNSFIVNVTEGALTSVHWAVDNNATSHASTRYEYDFVTATTGTISSITISVPSGTAGTPAVQENWGIGAGSVSLAGTTLTYTITSAITVIAGTPIRLVFSGLTNTAMANTYTSTINTGLDSGTSSSVTFGASNSSSGVQPFAPASTVTPMPSSATIYADPLHNTTATFTYTVTLTTNACTLWTLSASDGGLIHTSSPSFTFTAVTSGVGAAGSWPSGQDKSLFGYSPSISSASNGSATLQGTLSGSNWAGFKTSGEVFVQGTPTSGQIESVTFQTILKAQVSMATPDGTYTDAPTLTFTPSLC